MNEASRAPENQILAIASGKGGVGKTVITANLALSLAQQLHERNGKVVAVDLDLGCGNLNTCLGVRAPNGTINDFLLKQVNDLERILTPTEQKNLQMICCSYTGLTDLQIDGGLKESLLNDMTRLRANFILLDLGAGTSADVLDFFLGASERIVVITPESLSLHNAFMFLKRAILRFLSQKLQEEDFLASVNSKLREIVDIQQDLNIRGLIEQVKLWDPYAAYVLAGMIEDLSIKFIINMYRGGADQVHLLRFHNLLFKYLCLRSNLNYLGFVHFERRVMKSVQGVKPFLLRYPNNRAAREIRQLAARLILQEPSQPDPPFHFPKRFSWPPLLSMARHRRDRLVGFIKSKVEG